MGSKVTNRRKRAAAARPLLRVEGSAALHQARAVRWHGTEQVSQPFLFHLELEVEEATAAAAEAFATSCLGKALAVELAVSGVSRWFHGEVAACHWNACAGVDLPRVVLELRPALWRLSRTRDTRLFVEKTAQQIVDAVFAEHGLSGEYQWRAATGHVFRVRPHTWQHAESDLDFVARLLAAEGFHYWFTFTRTSHRLILANGPPAIPAGEATYPLGSGDPATDSVAPCVAFLRRSWSAVPARCVVRGRSSLEPDKVVEGHSSDASRNVPPGASGTLYEPAATCDEVTQCRTAAGRRLDAASASARTIDGESNVCQMAAGQFVKIDPRRAGTGPSPATPAGGNRLRLLAVHHAAEEATRLYSNRFEAIPPDAPCVAPPHPPPPCPAGPTAAEVMAGPDEHGRFRLRFDGDRTGAISSWVPMAHPQETVFFPRVGERVGVHFQQGDLDRPAILGRLPTAGALPFAPDANPQLGGITTPAHKLWFESGDARWALLEIAGRLRESVQGNRETVIQRDLIETVLGGVSCSVDQSWAGKVGKQFGLEAQEVVFRAADRMLFTVGGSCIAIDASGITINGAPLVHLNPPGGASGAPPGKPAALPEAPQPKPPAARP